MLTQAANADVYTDFQGLEGLRRAARADSPQALHAVAKQFESLFMQMMLKSMRQAGFGDPLFDNSESELYRDMFDQQIALKLGGSGSLGIAEMLVRQLSGPAPAAGGGLRRFPGSGTTGVGPGAEPALPAPVAASPAAGGASGPANAFASRQAFLDTLAPEAARTGARLGLDPDLLLAQAALETGWGRAILRRPEGGSSHNLFGIKADGRWSGASATVGTLEYEGGTLVRRQAAFRAYESFGESFDDYAAFLGAGDRYQGALRAAADPERYIRELQVAGYATDPAYADKVLAIWRELRTRPLKTADLGPLH